MDIKIGAEVQCTDGSAGHISRIILNPIENALTHIVVNHDREEYEIGVGYIASANEYEVKLNCSTHYLFEQPNFMETEYIREPLEHQVVDNYGHYYSPYVTLERYTVKQEHIPLGELAFTRGTHVFAEGGRIGQIGELVVNPVNYQITHVILREGHLWGKKDVVIGVEHIKDINDEGVSLNLTKEQIENLPTLTLKRHYDRKVEH